MIEQLYARGYDLFEISITEKGHVVYRQGILSKKINVGFHIDQEQEANKGVRGMPRLSETMKDVVSCEKLRGTANEC